MKIILISFLLLVPLFIFAQVGINTDNPQATFDIHSLSLASDSILTLRDSTYKALFNINDDGKIRTNDTKEGPTLFDIRSNNDGDIIAIGNTNLSHTDAGEGVIKYNADTKSMSLSVDTGWLELSKRPLRVLVSLEPYANSIIESGTTKVVKNWSVVSDSYGSADPKTGYFTAPHDGIYGVYVNMVFQRTEVKANTYIQTEIHSSTGRVSASIYPYYVDADEYPIVQTTNYFKLQKGDTLFIQVYHNVGTDLIVLHQYTYLSIVEF